MEHKSMSDRKMALPHKSMKIAKESPNFADLSGTKFGKLLVTGWLGKGKWQVKCDCGNYTKRKGSSLKDENVGFACAECLGKAQKMKSKCREGLGMTSRDFVESNFAAK